jgi:hypothetical protein
VVVLLRHALHGASLRADQSQHVLDGHALTTHTRNKICEVWPEMMVSGFVYLFVLATYMLHTSRGAPCAVLFAGLL